MSDIKKGIRFSPSLCVTHSCNLDCIYCYQTHDGNNRMSYETACKSIDWIFANIPSDMSGVEISFIGGEPLIEFDFRKHRTILVKQAASASDISGTVDNPSILSHEAH